MLSMNTRELYPLTLLLSWIVADEIAVQQKSFPFFRQSEFLFHLNF